MSKRGAQKAIQTTLAPLGYVQEPRGWPFFVKPLSDHCYLCLGIKPEIGSATAWFAHPELTQIVRANSEPAPQYIRAIEAELDARFERAFDRLGHWHAASLIQVGWSLDELADLCSTEDPNAFRRAAIDLDREFSKGDWNEEGIAAQIAAETLGGVPTHTLAWHARRSEWSAFDHFLERLLESFATRFPEPHPKGVVAYARAEHVKYAERLRRNFAAGAP